MFHLLWILLIIANLIIQLTYFRNPSPTLYLAKRITTPAMLWGGAAVIFMTTGRFALLECSILLAMGLGEIGIEGSQVVEARTEAPEAKTPWTVTAAGVLFLMVNVTLGVVLLVDSFSIIGIILGPAAVILMVLLLRHTYVIPDTVRFQVTVYAVGLAVLAAGAVSALVSGLDSLGIAGLVLTVSDSLVLWRMGAGWDKADPKGYRRLFAFLVVILLLYYGYIGVLIDRAAPFLP